MDFASIDSDDKTGRRFELLVLHPDKTLATEKVKQVTIVILVHGELAAGRHAGHYDFHSICQKRFAIDSTCYIRANRLPFE
jgi:hypothetical protein